MFRLVIVFFLITLFVVGCDAPENVSSDTVNNTTNQAKVPDFTNITQIAGLADFKHETGAVGNKWFPETMGSGVAVLDFDGDGFPDIIAAGGGAWAASENAAIRNLWLYQNNGDGTFSLVENSGLETANSYTFGLSVADYDNDGDPDLYVTTTSENLLFRNDDGKFIDVSQSAGVTGKAVWSSSATFFDADNDGSLDLYVGQYVDWSPENDLHCSLDGQHKSYCTPEIYAGISGQFYHNNGDGTFTDWTEKVGMADAPGKTLGVAMLDFDKNGWADLVVANDTEPDLLYQNNGDGTFTELGVASGLAFDERGKARAGMGIVVGQLDDSDEDAVWVGNFINENIGLYRHMGFGQFLDRASYAKISRPSLLTLTFGITLADLDLDGDLDAITANGHIEPEISSIQENIAFKQVPHLFINNGKGKFEDVAGQSEAFNQPMIARGIVSFDFDQDGDLDLLFSENDGGLQLLRNDLASESTALQLVLSGKDQKNAIGTRVQLVVGNKRYHRTVVGSEGYLSQSEMMLTFGLNGASAVDSVIVNWAGGDQQVLTDVPAGRLALVQE